MLFAIFCIFLTLHFCIFLIGFGEISIPFLLILAQNGMEFLDFQAKLVPWDGFWIKSVSFGGNAILPVNEPVRIHVRKPVMTETGAPNRYSNMFENMFEYRFSHTNMYSNLFSTLLEYR